MTLNLLFSKIIEKWLIDFLIKMNNKDYIECWLYEEIDCKGQKCKFFSQEKLHYSIPIDCYGLVIHETKDYYCYLIITTEQHYKSFLENAKN